MTKELTELGQWKVGQKLYIKGSGTTTGYEAILPIDRITDGRGGTIYVGSRLFDINGHQRGSDVWGKVNIREATEADYISIRGKNAKSRISNVNWLKLDAAKAIEIEKLLNDNGIETRQK